MFGLHLKFDLDFVILPPQMLMSVWTIMVAVNKTVPMLLSALSVVALKDTF